MDVDLYIIANGWKYLCETQRTKYYTKDGKIARATKNTFKELGYLEDNLSLYKRLCDSI
jgi:hypothetical protein